MRFERIVDAAAVARIDPVTVKDTGTARVTGTVITATAITDRLPAQGPRPE
jgi:hypothetical protein